MQNITLTREDKRESGQFYTPAPIAEYMVDYLGLSDSSTILDPTCGCGAFLVKIFEHLNNKFHRKDLIKNIYGVDINKEAVEQTRENLINYVGGAFEKTIYQNVRHGNSIQLAINTFRWELEFPSVFKQGGFDFVIGNPPYFTIKDENEFDRQNPIYAESVNGVVNAASLITATGYELLKEGGKLIFLLPKSLTRVKSYEKLRNLLLNRASITQIFDLGVAFDDVRGEQIILCFQKKKPSKNNVEIRRFSELQKNLSDQPTVIISQDRYANLENFLILPNKNLYKVAEQLAKVETSLNDLCEGNIFRGISLDSTNTIISKDWGVSGRLISQFSLKGKFPVNSEIIKGYANKISLMKRPKIILQNIYSRESGVKTFYDDKGLITADTVTNVIVNKTDPKYILAVLNSKLMTFYLSNVIFNGSVLTMHTDKEYIGRIPIVIPEQRLIRKVVNLIDELTQNADQWKIQMSKIDEIIYEIYEIKKEDQVAINQILYETMSQRSFW